MGTSHNPPQSGWIRWHVSLSLLALGLVGLVWMGHVYRRAFIRAFFVDGPGDGARPVLSGASSSSSMGLVPGLVPMPDVDRVRVVLIDGLSRSVARGLPALDALCEAGHDLRVDVGFPTVSLPVQYVLFTGLTQGQTGVLFRGKKDAKAPIPGAVRLIPTLVPGSVAVAESHGYIVNALGFSRAFPADSEERAPAVDDAWRDQGFPDRAEAEVTGDARLVVVHILRVDVAGHRLGGRDSAAYGEAARWADALLGRLVDADARAHGSGTRWLVLSDHGHRGTDGYAPGGGHGGATDEIRVVRGCVMDTGPGSGRTQAGRTGFVHLIDIARTLADSLDVRLHERSAGRPLPVALAAPEQPGATLPRPGVPRLVCAIALIVLALVITAWAARARWLTLPWWWAAAVFSVAWIETAPSLSHPMVFRALHPMVYVPALPGLAVLAVQWSLIARRGRTDPRSPWFAATALLAGPALVALACTLVAAGPDVLAIAAWDLGWNASIEPPLMPWYTGRASVLMALVLGGAFTSTIALTTWLAAAGIGRWR